MGFLSYVSHAPSSHKKLHRMLNRRGNPTARTLAAIIRAIHEDLGLVPRVTVAVA